jgi:hypothetical protein
VIRLVTTRLETERAHKVEVHCTDEDGRAVLPQSIMQTLPPRQVPANYPPGWDLASSIVNNLAGVPIPHAGCYSFEILVDDQQVRTLPFRAVNSTTSQTV